MLLEFMIAMSGLLAASAPTTVRVASYNTWLIPLVSDEFFVRRDAMGPALAALEPDLLCLQEVWDQGSLDAIEGALAHRLPHLVEGGGGLALLSRWPVHASRFTAFPLHDALPLSERLAKKGWIDALIAAPTGPVRVVVTHLAFARGEGREAHRAQVETLAAALAADRALPTVLCGDLNARAVEAGVLSADLRRLADLGFIDPALAPPDLTGLLPRRAATRLGWPRDGGPGRGGDPDYLLYRPGDRREVRHITYRQALDTPETALSDHNLLLVDLVLE